MLMQMPTVEAFERNLKPKPLDTKRASVRHKSGVIRFDPQILPMARLAPEAVYDSAESRVNGLSDVEVETRRAQFGPNEITSGRRDTWYRRLLRTLINPLVLLLSVLGTISFATGDARACTVMFLMVLLGVTLRFVQEYRADNAAAKLKAMIHVTTTVMRDGRSVELPVTGVVPGDVITLAAGDMIPADVRLVRSKDLFITQASLTGESMPVEKIEIADLRDGVSPLELHNICFLGTSVESGTATAIAITTGRRTYFGSMAGSIAGPEPVTSFDRGINRFTWLMIRFMLAMVPLVFIINGATKHNWGEAFFFAMAVAVGLTPEMLPMIVSVCLSKGALAMSGKKVIVKKLSAIQNFGAMDVLCTDKTGTLTLDRVIIERYCDVLGEQSDAVLRDAYLISHFQTGLKNVLDRAIFEHTEMRDQHAVGNYEKVDEIPFDFARRMMSVAVREPDGTHLLLTKGAPEALYERCTLVEINGEVVPMEPIVKDDLREEYERLSRDGFRVLAVAFKDLNGRSTCSKADENDLVLKGYVAFLDPPKESAAAAIAALGSHGVAIKVLTGDNDLISRKVCREVGLPVEFALIGSDIEAMSDTDLVAAVAKTQLFARLSPAHKLRIINTLQAGGHVVGFMGDGINDAPAIRAADVGISVDSAVDIAKEAADVILLEKSLMVLVDGVVEGRKVFANILKYVRMGASSNFGNMFSVLGASAFLPFVPMAPIQVLTNNLLYDFSQVPIPADNVDADQVTKPRPWDIGQITRFILWVGPISSIFDYTTFFVMLNVFHCWSPGRASLFQTGWFVESLMTQTLIIHVIRTNRIPFIQSVASWPLVMTSVLIAVTGVWLPYSPLAPALGLTALPIAYWPILFLTLLCYSVFTQVIKASLLRRALM